MKYLEFGESKREISQIIIGLMRIAQMTPKEVEELVETALSVGINAFDLADIYGGGKCEEILGQVLKNRPDLRAKMWIQSKVGIRIEEFTYFDFSKDYILEATNGILQRLGLDHLDSLLLHRPDALMEPSEIAEAFDLLKSQGKVLDFGVSNQNPMMMELLKKEVKQPLVANQLQLSAAFSPAFESGFHVNMEGTAANMRDGSIFEYCRLNDVVIQAWSVLQHGYFEGVFVGSDKYQISPSAVAIAWVLRYPAHMQAIIGTTKTSRIIESSKATDIELTRKEWYEIYWASGKDLP